MFADRAEVHNLRGDREKRDADLRQALRLGGSEDYALVLEVTERWASEGRWGEITPVLSAAFRTRPADLELASRLCVAQLKGGDDKGHAVTCASLLKSLVAEHDGAKIWQVLQLYLLAPGSLSDWSELLRRADDVIRFLAAAEQRAEGQKQEWLRGERGLWLITKGALLHRAGKHADALSTFQEGQKLVGEGKLRPSLGGWLVLIHAALGGEANKEAARKALAEAQGGPKPDNVWGRAQFEILLEEAQRAVRRLDEN
jgi:hypothetical protein